MVVHRLAAARSRYRVEVVGPAVPEPTYPGISFNPVRVPRFLPFSASRAYAGALTASIRRISPVLIEVHNKPDIAAWLARRFPAIPVCVHLHNDPRSMRGARSPAARTRLLASLAGVSAVSAWVADAFMEGVGGAGRVTVLHNAIDMTALPRPLPQSLRPSTMVFAGRVVPDKGPDAFIAACGHALPRLPGWAAVIIGADGFSKAAEHSAFIEGLRPAAAAAGVSMLGYREHADVLRALSQAAIAVVPSRWPEPFGLAALEAMACGAALLYSARGALAEVVADAGLPIDPDDPAAFGAILVRLATDLVLREALSAAGRQRAHDVFGIDRAMVLLDASRDGLVQPGTSRSALPSDRCM